MLRYCSSTVSIVWWVNAYCSSTSSPSSSPHWLTNTSHLLPSTPHPRSLFHNTFNFSLNYLLPPHRTLWTTCILGQRDFSSCEEFKFTQMYLLRTTRAPKPSLKCSMSTERAKVFVVREVNAEQPDDNLPRRRLRTLWRDSRRAGCCEVSCGCSQRRCLDQVANCLSTG